MRQGTRHEPADQHRQGHAGLKSEHVQPMRDSAADADEVNWTEIPLDEAMAMVRPGMIFRVGDEVRIGNLNPIREFAAPALA